MKVRTLTLAVGAAAVALLLPALQTGAAAEPGHKDKKGSPSPVAGCSVVVDPASSVGSAGGPVLQDAQLKNDPLSHPANAGFFVERTEYPHSSTFDATIAYTPPATGGCGSISLLTFPLKDVGGQSVYGPEVQSRTVELSGTATSVSITSLLVGLPADSQRNSGGLCVGSQIEVRDSNGAVTATFPESGPLDFCPVPGGRVYGG